MNSMREVNFERFCPECKHFNKSENEEPCDECTNACIRMFSQRPLRFEKEDQNGN